MANMVDYLAWRGDVSFDLSPWNEVDALLFATLSYLNFHGLQDQRGWTLREARRIDLLIESTGNTFERRKKMFESMAETARFGEIRLHHFIALTDEDISMQFSAECADLPDGTMAVIFRGTDNTLVGWREDFNMSCQTRVPGQQAAAYYLLKAARHSDRPIRVIGHSKGGNLSVYAAASVPEWVQNRIESIWSFDGPGLNQEVARSEGYERIRGKIHSYIPQTSIIGLLMEYFRPYTVVRAAAKGLEQHDPMTWQVYGTHFEEMESIDRTATVTCESLHELLTNSTPEQRATFVDTLFRLADNTNATRMSDILNEKFRSLVKMSTGTRELDPETLRVFRQLAKQAVSLGVGNFVEHVRRKSEQDGPDEWSTMDADEAEKFKSSRKAAAELPARRFRMRRPGRKADEKPETEEPSGTEEKSGTAEKPETEEKSKSDIDKKPDV